MIITSDDIDGILVLKAELAKQFEIKDLVPLKYLLGIEVAYSHRGYLLSQSKYVTNTLERARFTNNKIVDTPIEVNAKYFSFDGAPLSYPILYCTIVGAWYILLLLILIMLMLCKLLVNVLFLPLKFIGQSFFVFRGILEIQSFLVFYFHLSLLWSYVRTLMLIMAVSQLIANLLLVFLSF